MRLAVEHVSAELVGLTDSNGSCDRLDTYELRVAYPRRGVEPQQTKTCSRKGNVPITRWALQLPLHLRGLTVGLHLAGYSDPTSIQELPRLGFPKDLHKEAEYHLGDPLFSQQVFVTGPLASVSAVFSEGVRARTMGILRTRCCRVWKGWVELFCPRWIWDESKLQEELDFLLRWARSICFPAVDTCARLAQIASQDSLPLIRQQALRRLVSDFPRKPETFCLLEKELEICGGTQEMCFLRKGQRSAPQILRSLLDGYQLSARSRAQALGLLIGSGLTSSEKGELYSLLNSDDSRLQLLALEALGEFPERSFAVTLHKLAYRPYVYPEVRQAAKWALRCLRSRLGREAQGALSLCSSETGGLSFTATKG